MASPSVWAAFGQVGPCGLYQPCVHRIFPLRRLPDPPEPRAARRRRDRRRPAAGAGRRRHRQDPRADHPLRPHPADRPRLPQPGPGRHLHQQGGARDARTGLAPSSAEPAEGLWLGTFHALCARMLRRHAEQVGLSSNFTILDTDDQLRLLKQVMEAERIDTKRWAPAGADGGDPALEGSRPDAGARSRRTRTPTSPTAARARSMPPIRSGCAR